MTDNMTNSVIRRHRPRTNTVFKDRQKIQRTQIRNSRTATDGDNFAFLRDEPSEVGKREKNYRTLSAVRLKQAQRERDLSNNNGFSLLPHIKISKSTAQAQNSDEDGNDENTLADHENGLNRLTFPKIKQSINPVYNEHRHCQKENFSNQCTTQIKQKTTLSARATDTKLLDIESTEQKFKITDTLKLPKINSNMIYPQNKSDRLNSLRKENDALLSRLDDITAKSNKNVSPKPDEVENDKTLSQTEESSQLIITDNHLKEADYSENRRSNQILSQAEQSKRLGKMGTVQSRKSAAVIKDGLPTCQGFRKDQGCLPESVNTLLRSRANKDKEMCHCKPRGRTGLDAFNDVEEKGIKFQKNEKEKRKRLKKKRFVSAVERMSQRRMRMGSVYMWSGGRDGASSRPGGTSGDPTRSSSASTIKTACERIAFRMEQRKAFAGLVNELVDMKYMPDPDSQQMQRRGAICNGDLGKIFFVQTLQVNTELNKCPKYIIDGYRRAAETITFTVPCDVTSLESVTPLQYLAQHTRVEPDLRKYYKARFNMFRRSVTSSIARQESDDLETLALQTKQKRWKEGLFLAMNKIFFGQFGQSNYNKLYNLILPDEDIQLLSLNDFVGLCALAERCFWRVFEEHIDKAYKRYGCRSHLEHLDFGMLERRMADLELPLRLKIVLNSLA